MKKHLDEFKAFAIRGNVMDLAVGVIIGGAFGKIVSSLVNDLIMPLLSTLTGNVNYADLKIVLTQGTETQTEVAILYGNFIKSTVDFFLIALSIFFVIKLLNRMKKKEEVVVVNVPVEDSLSVLKEIRDNLKNK